MKAKLSYGYCNWNNGYIEIRVDEAMLLSVIENLDVEIGCSISMHRYEEAMEIIEQRIALENKLEELNNAERESTENS